LPDQTTDKPIEYPPGDWAIIELFGHTTMVGRIAEVDRYGTKMLAIEPLFDGKLLPVVFHGGAAIYRETPCSAEIAFRRQPTRDYQLPPAVRATLPAGLLEGSVTDMGDERDTEMSDNDYCEGDEP
jgi:hypothetical protein